MFKQLKDSITFTVFSVLWFDSRTHDSFTRADASHFVMWNESGQLGQCQSLAGTRKGLRRERAGETGKDSHIHSKWSVHFTSSYPVWCNKHFPRTNNCIFFYLTGIKAKFFEKIEKLVLGRNAPPPETVQYCALIIWLFYNCDILVKFSVKRLFFCEVALKQ